MQSNGCRRVDGYRGDVCGTNLCEWAQTQEEIQNSLEKARQNFIKKHGFDGYFDNPNAKFPKEDPVLRGRKLR